MAAFREADLLIELLDQQLSYLHDQKDVQRRLFALPRFLKFLRRDPQLSGLLSELDQEDKERLREFAKADAALRARLLKLWKERWPELQELLRADLDNEQMNARGRPADFEKAVSRSASPEFDDWSTARRVLAETRNLTLALRHWMQWASQRAEELAIQVPSSLHDAAIQLNEIDVDQTKQERDLALDDQSSGGAAYKRLGEVASRLSPLLRDESPVGQARFFKDNDFAEKVHGTQDVEAHRVIDPVHNQVMRDAVLLHDELRLRVSTGRSRRSLIRRYAARCEAFDAARLRGIASGDTRNAERLLTLDLARYLFDQGLTPVVDPTIGGLRPDIVDFRGGNLFYVEAKQYAERSPKSYLVNAYKQVWDTWARLENQTDVSEAFVIVFRRSGPLVKLPEVLRFKGNRLYSVVADISEDAGSSAKHAPVTLSEADLLPTD